MTTEREGQVFRQTSFSDLFSFVCIYVQIIRTSSAPKKVCCETSDPRLPCASRPEIEPFKEERSLEPLSRPHLPPFASCSHKGRGGRLVCRLGLTGQDPWMDPGCLLGSILQDFISCSCSHSLAKKCTYLSGNIGNVVIMCI